MKGFGGPRWPAGRNRSPWTPDRALGAHGARGTLAEAQSSHRASKTFCGKSVFLKQMLGCGGVICFELGSWGEAAGWQTEVRRPTRADRVLFGTATNLCEVPAKDRVDCGYPNITPEQCTGRGCCFDSSTHGVPWCFKPLQDTGERARGRGVLPGSPEATHARAGPPAPRLSIGGGLSQGLSLLSLC